MPLVKSASKKAFKENAKKTYEEKVEQYGETKAAKIAAAVAYAEKRAAQRKKK